MTIQNKDREWKSEKHIKQQEALPFRKSRYTTANPDNVEDELVPIEHSLKKQQETNKS